MDPQKLKEIKMLRRASRASNTEHLMRQNSQNQSFTSDELQKTSTRELISGDSHSKSGFELVLRRSVIDSRSAHQSINLKVNPKKAFIRK